MNSILGDKFRELRLYSGVRREWRCEINNWLNVDTHTLNAILIECKDGMWGHYKSSIYNIVDLYRLRSSSEIEYLE